ncbi:MAG: glycosyltransferase family 4 protein [Ktedonobacteraceae bacterium]
MKIAQIAPPWLPIPPEQYGGTENVIYHLVEAQVALGHDVTLFAPGDAKTSARLVSFFPRSLMEEGVPWTMHLKAYYHLHKAIEQVKEQRFDIVHTHLSSSADMYTFPLTASLDTPHVATLHSRFPFDRDARSGKIGDADLYYMEWADNLPTVAISESARNQEGALASLNFVGVVHNGLSIQEYRLSGAPRKNYFAWLGRFAPEKGAHLAIEAALKAGIPLVLAGTIDRHSKESMDYFHGVIKPHIGTNQVSYIGPVNLKQKLQLLNSARGFLNPIEWEEPFGMVMIEAMSQGCPVISFARGSAPEIVVDGVTGFLVQTLKEMVERIPDIDTIDRDVVREHIERNFSAKVMAEKYIDIYKQLIAMKSPLTLPLRYPLVKTPIKTAGMDRSQAASSSRN